MNSCQMYGNFSLSIRMKMYVEKVRSVVCHTVKFIAWTHPLSKRTHTYTHYTHLLHSIWCYSWPQACLFILMNCQIRTQSNMESPIGRTKTTSTSTNSGKFFNFFSLIFSIQMWFDKCKKVISLYWQIRERFVSVVYDNESIVN